ncbi:MAG TPA: YncE family protein [Candidatus Angelobacter sp.]|jgi:YVTN family beta-propeller protein|nr:YncE family protein [Candidatus Angelobacter sp.]
MKVSFKAMWLLASLGILMLVAAGCNDTLRQFIVPVPSPSGDPGRLAHAIVLSTNPAAPPNNNGTDMHVNVSGDSSVGIVPLGLNPVFLGKTSNQAFVINSGNPGAGVPATVSIYIALLPTSNVSTVTLPPTSSGPVAGATSSSGNIYIANRSSNNVDLIAAGVFAVTASIPVPTPTPPAPPASPHPVMIAGNGANNKIFVVNQGTNNVTEISTIDNTVIKNIPVGSSPIWAVMSSDGLFVFVVNQGDGTVSVIDTSLDIVLPCVVGPSCPSGNAIKVGTTAASSPNFAFYEPTLKRVYVTNTGEQSVTVIKANGIDLGSNPQVLPSKIADIPVSGFPTSIAALSDGTKAYAALGNCPAGVNHLSLPDPVSTSNASHCPGNLVSVIDVVGLRETGTITVGPGAVSIDASSDASRVYVISANDVTTVRDDVHAPNCTDTACLPGAVQPDRTFPTPSISVIRTATNSVLVTPVNPGIVNTPLPTFHVPQQDPNCVPTIDPNFNDDVPLPCPLQTPFVVHTFP